MGHSRPTAAMSTQGHEDDEMKGGSIEKEVEEAE